MLGTDSKKTQSKKEPQVCSSIVCFLQDLMIHIHNFKVIFNINYIYIHLYIYTHIHICYFEQFSLLIGNNGNLYFSILWVDYILITVKIMLWITFVCIFYFTYVYMYMYICVYTQMKSIWNKDMHTYIFSRFLKWWIFRLYPDYCYM